jgi:hypothetical protein
MKTDNPGVIQVRRLMFESLQSDLHQAMGELRADYPGLSPEHLLALLRRKRPALWLEMQRVEAASAQED